jgi:hypothetical protein
VLTQTLIGGVGTQDCSAPATTELALTRIAPLNCAFPFSLPAQLIDYRVNASLATSVIALNIDVGVLASFKYPDVLPFL